MSPKRERLPLSPDGKDPERLFPAENLNSSGSKMHPHEGALRRRKQIMLLQTLVLLSLGFWQQKLCTAAEAASDLSPTTTTTTSSTPRTSSAAKNTSPPPSSEDDDWAVIEDDHDEAHPLPHVIHHATQHPIHPTMDRDLIIAESAKIIERYQPRQVPTRTDTHQASKDHHDDIGDIIVVATVDGTLAGLSKATGALIWKRHPTTTASTSGNHHDPLSTQGPPTIDHHHLWKTQQQVESEAPLLRPLLSTTTTVQTSASSWRTMAVPSLDGRVYLTAKNADNSHPGGPFRTSSRGGASDDPHETGATEVTVTTLARDLVARAPFVDGRGRVYTASRRSTAAAINGRTGEILRVVAADQQCTESQDPNTSQQQQQQQQQEQQDPVIWLGRVDYEISIHEPRSGDLDVRFTSAEIMSVHDMMLGSGGQQSWPPAEGDHAIYTGLLLRPSDQTDAWRQRGSAFVAPRHHVAPVVATPNGNLAFRDPKSGRILWVAEECFDTPVAFAIDSTSGSSLLVEIVPDAVMPHGSKDYVTREIERQLKTSQSLIGQLDDDDDDDDGQKSTLVGSLSSGQLYAVPLGPRVQNTLGLPHRHLHHPTSISAAKAIAQPKLPSTAARHTVPNWQHHHHHPETTGSYWHGSASTGGKRGCMPGSSHFPACLVRPGERTGSAWRGRDGGFFPDVTVTSPFDEEDHAIVPFFHPDYGYIIPEHLYAEQTHKRYRKLLRILGSWLPPTIALIFVVSFELGRRKRLKDDGHKVELDSNVVTDKDTKPTTATEGVIQVFDDKILGYGGHGTVVYKGMLDGRHVAVKRMLKAYHASADREISLLIESDGHPNVVRYFLKEVRGDFVYLALELCDLSLHDLIGHLRSSVELPNRMPQVKEATKTILHQIAQGVKHLHHLRIVHRDLKPANILLADSRKKKSKEIKEDTERTVFDTFRLGFYVAKISDMGLGKQLVGQSSYGASLVNDASMRGISNGGQSSVVGAGAGSVGWQAPEVMALRATSDSSVRSEASTDSPSPIDAVNNARTSRSTDIFSLGCIFYSTLLPGLHPFGEWYEREANIMHNRPNLQPLKEVSRDAFDLVSEMVHRSPSSRPTAKEICEHPFFWRSDRRVSFLSDFSDRIETEASSSGEDNPLALPPIVLAVERNATQVVGISWDRVLDKELISNVQKFRTYDPSSVRDLLRLIRNKHHHFDDLPPNLKESITSNEDGLMNYFEARFPGLLIHCFNICRDHLGSDDSLAIKYSLTPSKRVSYKKLEVHTSSIAEVSVVSDTVGNETEFGATNDYMLSDHTVGDVTEPVVSKEISSEITCVETLDCLRNPHSITDTLESTTDTDDIVVWFGSAAARSFNCRGWNRSDDEWERRVDVALRTRRDSNLMRFVEDPKFRTRLCNHWDTSHGSSCPMRKKNKCVFAHGPVELRVKEGKRQRWGKLVDKAGDNKNPHHSGGEDTYGAARSIETERKQEGKWNTDAAQTPGKCKKTPGSSKKKPAQASPS